MAMYPPIEKRLGVDEEPTLLSDEILTDGDRNNLPIHVVYPPAGEWVGVDEEPTLLSEEVLTDGDRNNLPIHVQRDDSEETLLKPGNSSALRTAWRRFNGHGRRRIGFLQSLTAVVLFSCMFPPIAVTSFKNRLQTPRLERVADSHTIGLDFSLPPLGPEEYFCTHVLRPLD